MPGTGPSDTEKAPTTEVAHLPDPKGQIEDPKAGSKKQANK